MLHDYVPLLPTLMKLYRNMWNIVLCNYSEVLLISERLFGNYTCKQYGDIIMK